MRLSQTAIFAGAVDWENNLFESVNINVNPATWWFNGVVNFDEAFTARNNLFHGGHKVKVKGSVLVLT